MSEVSFRVLCGCLTAVAAVAIITAAWMVANGYDAPTWFGAVAVSGITALAALARPPRSEGTNGKTNGTTPAPSDQPGTGAVSR